MWQNRQLHDLGRGSHGDIRRFERQREVSLRQSQQIGGIWSLRRIAVLEPLAESSNQDTDGCRYAWIIVLGLPHDVTANGLLL